MKGLFSASVPAHLEEHTGSSVLEHFDLVTGTSTGGIIALALGAGFSAAQIRDFYLEHARTIFPPNRLGVLRQIWRPKHSSAGLKQVLTELLGDRKLGHSRCRLIIPAFDLVDGIHLFKTARGSGLQFMPGTGALTTDSANAKPVPKNTFYGA